jgi:hypothetical protein
MRREKEEERDKESLSERDKRELVRLRLDNLNMVGRQHEKRYTGTGINREIRQETET